VLQLQKREPEGEVFHDAHELNVDDELLLPWTSPTPTSCSAMPTRPTLTHPEIKMALTMFARTDGPPAPADNTSFLPPALGKRWVLCGTGHVGRGVRSRRADFRTSRVRALRTAPRG
jgi:hypothetical protein